MQYRFLLIILFYTSIFWGQQKITDSLEYIVKTKPTANPQKIIALSELALYYQSDSIRSLHTALQAVELAKQETNQQYSAYAYSSLALIYAQQSHVEAAYLQIDNTTTAINKTTVKYAQAIAYHRIGLSKFKLRDKDGLKDIYNSLHLLKKTDYKLQSLNYSLLTHYYLPTISQADKYSRLAIETALKSADWPTICDAWNARAWRFLSEYEKTTQPQPLDSALIHFKKALVIYEDHPGYISPDRAIKLLANLMYVYQTKQVLKPEDSNLNAMRFYLSQSMQIADQPSEDFTIDRYMIRIRAAIVGQNQEVAEKLFLELIDSIEQSPKYYRNLYELHHQLAQLYNKMQRHDESNKHLNEAFKYYRKFYDDRYIQIGQQQIAKFEWAKREIKLEKRQNLLYIGFSAVLIFIVLITTYTLHLFKHKKQQLRLLTEIREKETKNLEVAKVNAELVAQLKSEETSRLQKEIIAKKIQVSHKNEILLNLKKNIQDNVPFNPRQLEKILKSEMLLDKKFDGFEALVQRIHPDFYIRLQQQAANKLTALDLKYCACIYIKMPSKEMADLLYVELKTVRMTKYRLKIKLKLEKDVDLEDFIQNIV